MTRFGKKSSRLVRAAAVKLAQELFNMVARPPHTLVTRLQEGTETQVFKTYFLGWEEVIAVDFTRTAESVARTGADLASWAKQQETKADLSALFTPRQPAMSAAEAKTLADEWNEDLEAMEAFVLEGRHFARLPDRELGVFYSGDCYVFLCRYVVPAEPEEEGSDVSDDAVRGGRSNGRRRAASGQAEGSEERRTRPRSGGVTSGRAAPRPTWAGSRSRSAWSASSTAAVPPHWRVVAKRTGHQQQESLKFMAHFHRRFIVRDGKRNQKPVDGVQPVELFELRSNGSALCTRLLQVRPDAACLNSAFWRKRHIFSHRVRVDWQQERPGLRQAHRANSRGEVQQPLGQLAASRITSSGWRWADASRTTRTRITSTTHAFSVAPTRKAISPSRKNSPTSVRMI
ncbi:hypothetical protein ACJJTC_004796 [Scirpophaga incertulas]